LKFDLIKCNFKAIFYVILAPNSSQKLLDNSNGHSNKEVITPTIIKKINKANPINKAYSKGIPLICFLRFYENS
jgi:hypothetical protein